MSIYELGFIGTGNMGGALACAAVKSVPPEAVVLCNRTAEKAETLARQLGCASGGNECAARNSRFLMLGVKPQMMQELLRSIRPILESRTDRFVLVSMAAGLSIQQIVQMAGAEYPVIRIMPNMPVKAGEGMILSARSALVTDREAEDFTAAFKAAGRIDWIPEALIDAGCAVAGCGPAFAAMFAEALADGGVACGLPRKNAVEYAAQMLLGTARMLLDGGIHPGALKDAVCSPAGSTIAGVRALEENGFRAACMQAVVDAYDRTKELGTPKAGK